MKLKPFLLISLLLLLFIAGGFYLYIRNQSKAETFVLIKEFGNVYYKKDGQYQPLNSDNIELESGTFVKTESGNAHVLLPDNSIISLDVNTEIQVSYSPTSVNILQVIGNSWHRVQSLEQGHDYSVQLPNLIAAVRGTIFGVGVSSEGEEVFVVDNSVDLIKKDGVQKLGTLVIGKIGIFKDNKFTIDDMPDTLRKTEWFTKNIILDNDFLHLNKTISTESVLNNIKDLLVRDDLSPTPNNAFIEEMKVKLDYYLAVSPGDFCSHYKGKTVASILLELEAVEDKYQQSHVVVEQHRAIITAIANACVDGNITKEEIDSFPVTQP